MQELQTQLRRTEALRERDQGELQRELALHQAAADHARRQLAHARREGKDREALEQEIHELRLELTQAKNTMQIRLREQEAEFQRQCLELKATRLEEEKRQRREDARRSPMLTDRTTGGAEISRIEGSLEDVSMLSEGAAEAISKMKLLEDQLRSWQGMDHDKSLITGDPPGPAAVSDRPEVSAYHREAELLLEMQQEHLLTIRLNRQALEARRCAEFRMVRSASLPNSILDSIPSRLAKSPEASKQAMVPRSEPCLLQKLEASPNSAGAVLGSSRSNGANISASGSPPRDFVQPKEEAKEPSPSSCQALSPAPSLEAATADRPDHFVGAGPADSPMDVDTRCQGSPSRAAAGRLPPLAGVEKPPERGTIGLIGDLSPSRRPEIDTQQEPQPEAERPQCQEATQATEATQVSGISGTLDARLKEVELDRASWRRRTLLLEEQMQRLLQQQSAKEEVPVRWRPQALQLEEESTVSAPDTQDAWKEQRELLEAQLAQAVAERDRMIEATNELRADVRRLTSGRSSGRKGSREVSIAPLPLPSPQMVQPVQLPSGTTGGPSPATVMRQALEEDRFGVMGSASSSPEKAAAPAPPAPRITLSLPIPAAGTPGVAHLRSRPEVEVPGSASLSRSPSPPGWPPPSPETVHSDFYGYGLPMPPPLRPQPAAWSPGLQTPPMPHSVTTDGDASPAAMRVRDALKMLSPRRCKSTSPNRIR